MDDLETFDARSFVTRMLGLGDPEGLVKAMQDAGLDRNTELIKKMSEGKFTLRDM
jgi:signal recognition particle subunit SRP54